MLHSWECPLLAFLLSGCAVNPVSGKSEVALISAEEERELGAQEAEKVKQSMGLIDDPEILAYVRAVGRRLAEHSPRKDVDYTFHIVDMEVPNAFALPGGYVYVSRGLLALVNSEDELAGVMGHEIGHVAGRHAVQRVTPVGRHLTVQGSHRDRRSSGKHRRSPCGKLYCRCGTGCQRIVYCALQPGSGTGSGPHRAGDGGKRGLESRRTPCPAGVAGKSGEATL